MADRDEQLRAALARSREEKRPQRAGPDKVELFDPPAMVKAIVKGVEKRFATEGERRTSLNTTLDAFYDQLMRCRREDGPGGESPGTKYVHETMALLEKEIERRDPKLPLGGTT